MTSTSIGATKEGVTLGTNGSQRRFPRRPQHSCSAVRGDRAHLVNWEPVLYRARTYVRMTTMVTPADFGLSPRHFRIRGRHEMVELTPSLCPNGHRFENGSYLTGNSPCVACTGSSHRIWLCQSVRCSAGWIWPACKDRADLPEWDGITPPPR